MIFKRGISRVRARDSQNHYLIIILMIIYLRIYNFFCSSWCKMR